MKVEAVWKKNYQVILSSRQFRIPADEAPEYSGDDTGMMPTEMFLCSLASCFCMAIVYAARKTRLELSDMRVNVIGEKDVKNFVFKRCIVEIKSSTPTKELSDTVELAKKYCYITNTINGCCPLEYRIN